jgi:hypothetical protein
MPQSIDKFEQRSRFHIYTSDENQANQNVIRFSQPNNQTQIAMKKTTSYNCHRIFRKVVLESFVRVKDLGFIRYHGG